MDTKAKVVLALGSIVLVGVVAYMLLPGTKKPDVITPPPEPTPTTTEPTSAPATQPDPFAPPVTTAPATSSTLGQGNTPAAHDPWSVLDTGNGVNHTGGHSSLGSSNPDTHTTLGNDPSAHSDTPKTWRIAKGDSLATISTKVYGSPRYASRIAAANPKVNPRHLKTGQILNLPEVHIATPTPGPSVSANDTADHSSNTGSTGSALSGKTYKVVSGDSLRKIAQKNLGSEKMWEKIYELNKKLIGPDPAKLKVGTVLQLPESETSH